MYKEHFQISRDPFELTPDPTRFVATARHNEALASLYYAIRHHKGFAVVTGEVGTGKTLLLRCLLQLFKESKDFAYAYLFHSRLSPSEFLQYVLSDFGLETTGKNKSELLFTFGKFLSDRGAQQLTTVLIVDEAHDLSEELLEEVRLLSNLEAPNRKLLQIVLVGQPELDHKLDSFNLRQLKQRIAIRTHLDPLTLEETGHYIHQRLEAAGVDASRDPIFPESTVEAVYRWSNGLPRLINSVCENALISAYARKEPVVSPEVIVKVARDLRLDDEPLLPVSGASTSSEMQIDDDDVVPRVF
ncbi:MAG: AAA family ATPase [Terracidiphilus sp.]